MKVKPFAATAILALCTTVSLAQEAAPIPLQLTPAAGGLLQVTFERAVTGLFVDTFSFTPQSVSGTVSVVLVPRSGPVTFFAALLNGESFSLVLESGETTFRFQALATLNMPLSLTVLGFSGNTEMLVEAPGSYSGVIAVPEPATYALMFAGLAAVGAIARRRKALA